MHRQYHRWPSPALGRDMEILVFGRSGARVLAFPTSMGRFFDWEDCGNNEHLSQLLWDKGAGHALRIWEGWAHDWPYWQKMLPLYIGGHD